MTISADGFSHFNIWEHSPTVRELYTRRCLQEAEEMTCHAQGAELLAPLACAGDSLLDVGCGSGYFWHSLRTRNIPVEYWGMDAAEPLLRIGKKILPREGLAAERLLHMRIEDMRGHADHIFCCNVLSNIDNYHRPLERLLLTARKSIILRESLAQQGSYSYVQDKYLEPGTPASVHVNTYPLGEVLTFIKSYGYSAYTVIDERTGGQPEMVIDHPHYWTFIVALKQQA